MTPQTLEQLQNLPLFDLLGAIDWSDPDQLDLAQNTFSNFLADQVLPRTGYESPRIDIPGKSIAPLFRLIEDRLTRPSKRKGAPPAPPELILGDMPTKDGRWVQKDLKMESRLNLVTLLLPPRTGQPAQERTGFTIAFTNGSNSRIIRESGVGKGNEHNIQELGTLLRGPKLTGTPGDPVNFNYSTIQPFTAPANLEI